MSKLNLFWICLRFGSPWNPHPKVIASSGSKMMSLPQMNTRKKERKKSLCETGCLSEWQSHVVTYTPTTSRCLRLDLGLRNVHPGVMGSGQHLGIRWHLSTGVSGSEGGGRGWASVWLADKQPLTFKKVVIFVFSVRHRFSSSATLRICSKSNKVLV